jgi:cystathionine gamma-synthase
VKGNSKDAGFETRAIHAGQSFDPTTGAVNVPIYQTSTYAQHEVGRPYGHFEYSRTHNPTRSALEDCIASLEGGAFGLAFASGMAAESTLLQILKPGDHVILGDDVYGGTYRLFSKVLALWGIAFTLVDLTSAEKIEEAYQSNTKLVWLETPSNPWLRSADIAAVASSTHARNALLVVDNTFASPYLQRPLILGADFVVHSATKYLGGHSDVVLGIVVGKDEKHREVVAFHQNAIGAVSGPFDSYLVLRGLKTLSVRVKQHGENAIAIARFLKEHSKVADVFYPGLESDPGHTVARRNLLSGGSLEGIPADQRDAALSKIGFGGMLSFLAKDGEAAARKIVGRTQVFTLAESLGGVESLIEHPAAMTHASLAGSGVEIDPSLVRLSVGIENVNDLLADLDQALGEH